ncbi:hypothetical protein JCM5353_008096 [Sporobolomyces roseus]
MTRPIEIGASRKRQYKSCTTCRNAKAKCTGFSEEYLRLLDDPDFVPPPGHPVCKRCKKQGKECEFAPSRRKGRPRRLAKNPPIAGSSPRPSAEPKSNPSATPEPHDRAAPSRSPTPDLPPPTLSMDVENEEEDQIDDDKPKEEVPVPAAPVSPVAPPTRAKRSAATSLRSPKKQKVNYKEDEDGSEDEEPESAVKGDESEASAYEEEEE